ncbi:MAG TPA: hypothetical protein EYH02_00055, partial [Ignisphaera aggregans]|nr:hypothetical protein [Ignisphaera aggregans]
MYVRDVVNSRLCVLCRGANRLCGRAYCPILARSMALMKLSRVVNTVNVEGSSPPSVFVGRIGYPKVLAGPATPPEHGNTSLYDLPELWLDIPLESIVAFRGSLIVARRPVNVYDVESRYVQTLQELVLSVDPVDIEITLRKPPRAEISLSDFEPPIGPRAPVKDFYIVSYRATHRVIEKVYSDTDLSAREAVVKLYESSIPVTHIQKLFSVGALGKKRSRRLVPTRYAITAVDVILSDHLLKRVRELPELDSVLLFTRSIHNNLFAAILIPGKWSFEWMEAWFPGSTWNPYGKEVVIEGDYELYKGRKSYPSIGGCYYASRLATAEYML